MAQIFEEDIEAAHALAESILGPNGNIVYPLKKHVVPNATISTKEHGILWYGDFDKKNPRHTKGLDTLAEKLGVAVEVQ